ncbi:MAG: antibiotic acetyltransferase, partial [Sphingobacteriales bacterium]
ATKQKEMLLKHVFQRKTALLHKDLKCKAPLIEPNLRRNLGKWPT